MFGQLRSAFNTSGFSVKGISDMFVDATAAGHRVTRDVAEEVENTYLVKQIRGIECHEYMKPFRHTTSKLSRLSWERESVDTTNTLMINKYNILFL